MPYALLALLVLSSNVLADGGLMPLRMDRHGQARDEDVPLYEPEQRAIVLHDGGRERLILSTDVRGEVAGDALLILPLPALQEVAVAPREVFERLERLVEARRPGAPPYPEPVRGRRLTSFDAAEANEGAGSRGAARPPGVEVVVAGELAGHDFEYVRVLDPDEFPEHVATFCSKRGLPPPSVPERVHAMVVRYARERGCTTFFLDRLRLATEPQSLQPLALTFGSLNVFYPLTVSSLNQGLCTVSVTLLTAPALFELEPDLRHADQDLRFLDLRRGAALGVELATTAESLGGLQPDVYRYAYDVVETVGGEVDEDEPETGTRVETYDGPPKLLPLDAAEVQSLGQGIADFFEPAAPPTLVRLWGCFGTEQDGERARALVKLRELAGEPVPPQAQAAAQPQAWAGDLVLVAGQTHRIVRATPRPPSRPRPRGTPHYRLRNPPRDQPPLDVRTRPLRERE